MSRAHHGENRTPSMLDALARVKRGRRGPALDSDAPRASTFPGPKHRPLEGQLRIEPPKS